ncbi:hypothetical protein FQN53_009150 [Emmonsiellopsis sp. PD_33]|nr:hypothetical protein FQN53_009150 [Emmonsiellopsis sp. PD_33]
MGKKRKASKLSTAKKSAPVENSRFAADARFTDSEDEFEAGRDQVLLDEAPEAKRRRKLEEQEEFFQPSDEEVLGYQSESIDDEEDFDDDDVEDEGDFEEEDTRKSTTKKSNLRKRDASSPVDGEEEGHDEDEGITGWGSSKKDYYDADVIETEADALEEEAEAKKIQLQKLQSMNEADFGFDESEWATSGQDESRGRKVEDNVVTEVLPELQVTDDMSVAERRKILKQRYPEFEPLSKDFIALQPVHEELAAAAQIAGAVTNGSNKPSYTEDTPISVIKFRALSAYLGAVSMYFFLLTSPSRGGETRLAMSPAELREHPVMETLISCKKQWDDVRDLEEFEEFDEESDEGSEDEEMLDIPIPVTKASEKKQKLAKPTTVSEPKKSKAQKAIEEARALAEKKRTEKLRETEAGLAELSKLLDSQSTKKVSRQSQKTNVQNQQDDSDFGDETTLDALEAEEKANKKKSLRFYTSQIAQKANKRGAAGRDAGGDTDLPYRERLKDRQARLNAQAEKRGQRNADDLDTLGGDSDDEDHRIARDVRGEQAGSDDDDYYDMVAARSKQKKAEKKQLADAYAEAEREGGRVEIQEEIGADGKRAITYTIEKNKGLAPKRSKDVRNPRVKKRKKYEEKKKKLGSMRQVYKGGEGRGGYGGELTGIKKNLVKSVKL